MDSHHISEVSSNHLLRASGRNKPGEAGIAKPAQGEGPGFLFPFAFSLLNIDDSIAPPSGLNNSVVTPVPVAGSTPKLVSGSPPGKPFVASEPAPAQGEKFLHFVPALLPR